MRKKFTDDNGVDQTAEAIALAEIEVINEAAKVATLAELPGTWNAKTYNNISNVTVTSRDLPARVIALRATYYGLVASIGEAVGIAIDAVDAGTGEIDIEAGDTAQVIDGAATVEWLFTESTAITRVDFQSIVTETGTSKFILEWKVAS